MNLNNQPTIEQLSELFASRKDTFSSHILWICSSGDVRLDAIGPNVDEGHFQNAMPSMRARFRTYRQGKGYVGRKAAADRTYMQSLYTRLQQEWQASQQRSEVAYIDSYC